MRGITLLRQDFVRTASTLQTRQASAASQQDIKSAFSYCVQQVRCAAVFMPRPVLSTASSLTSPCFGRRTYDYDNYVWLLQLKQVSSALTPLCNCVSFAHPYPVLQELRAAIFAIRCFNIETGLVGETVKETGLLPIRMQWWKDAVNSMYRDKPVKHPAIQALAQVIPVAACFALAFLLNQCLLTCFADHGMSFGSCCHVDPAHTVCSTT